MPDEFDFGTVSRDELEAELSYPEVPAATMRELYVLAETVRRAEPWLDLVESDFFGLIDPATGDTCVVSVLGAAGQVYSVQVYQPPEGIRFWHTLYGGEEPRSEQAGTTDAVFDLRLVECEFANSADLEDHDLELFEKHGGGRAPGGFVGVPAFRAREPEYMPWPVDEAEAALIASALRLLPVFVERLMSGAAPSGPGDDGSFGPLPMFKLRDGGAAREVADWEMEIKPFPTVPDIADDLPVDEVFGARMAALKVKKGAIWECAMFHVAAHIPHAGKLAFPSLVLIQDVDSPMLREPSVGNPDEPKLTRLRRALADHAESAGLLPERLVVANRFVEAALAPLAGCGVQIERLEHLPLISPMIDELRQLMGDGAEDEAADLPNLHYTEPVSTTRYQVRVDLVGSEPPIWRRFTIPSDASLFALHMAVQDAMGWEDEHLHEFQLRRGRNVEVAFRMHDDEGAPFPVCDEMQATLEQLVANRHRTLFYIYDFGDDWEHKVKIEKTIKGKKSDKPRPLPEITDGEGACPPEDCGGLGGYYSLMAGDPSAIDWMDEDFVKAVQAETFKIENVKFSPAGEFVAMHLNRG